METGTLLGGAAVAHAVPALAHALPIAAPLIGAYKVAKTLSNVEGTVNKLAALERIGKMMDAHIDRAVNVLVKGGERASQVSRGEIAAGVSKQFSDDPARPNGANCYACHQLSKAELSYGTHGPSLYNVAKLRGFTAATQRYAYSKVYNSQAFSACSNMPRFGHSGILTEAQIKDVVALLMDPKSPINQ